jgi:serine/threonine protein kinase
MNPTTSNDILRDFNLDRSVDSCSSQDSSSKGLEFDLDHLEILVESLFENANRPQYLGRGGQGIVLRFDEGSKILTRKIIPIDAKVNALPGNFQQYEIDGPPTLLGDGYCGFAVARQEFDILNELGPSVSLKPIGQSVAVVDDVVYVITDLNYVEGDNLYKIFNNLDFKQRMEIICQIGTQVKALNEAGVVHSDIKPDNVIWDGYVATLIDFGLATRFGSCESEIGTPGYFSPEQASGAVLDDSTNNFQYGLLAIYLSTGKENITLYLAEGLGYDEYRDMMANYDNHDFNLLMEDTFNCGLSPHFIDALECLLSPDLDRKNIGYLIHEAEKLASEID